VERTEGQNTLPHREDLSRQELAQTLSQQGLSRREIARILFQEPYLAAFRERLPRYPYATDDPRQGMRPRRKEKALEHVYIQVGRYPHAIFRIVLDLDEPTWWDAMDRIPPTLTIPNPRAPWKAHIVYELEPPIWLSSPKAHEGQGNPFALVREVDALLRAYFGADPAYNGLLGRNPLAHAHLIGGGKLWDLPSLLEELRDLTPRRRVAAYLDTATYGRNCTLFDRVRAFAYGVVAMYRGKPNGFELFRQAVAHEAHRLNRELFRDHPQGPLPWKEVEATIVKSVSKMDLPPLPGDPSLAGIGDGEAGPEPAIPRGPGPGGAPGGGGAGEGPERGPRGHPPSTCGQPRGGQPEAAGEGGRGPFGGP
jgi:hypothetical protein